MKVFAVMFAPENATAPRILREKYPEGRGLEVRPGQWLLADTGTAKEVCEKLGMNESPASIPNAIVFSTAGYWGRAPTNVWEWIAARLSEDKAA